MDYGFFWELGQFGNEYWGNCMFTQREIAEYAHDNLVEWECSMKLHRVTKTMAVIMYNLRETMDALEEIMDFENYRKAEYFLKTITSEINYYRLSPYGKEI